MSILRIKDGQGNLINIPTHAIETPILDLSEYYDSENVEGALREIGQKIHNGVATPKEIEALIKQLDLIQSNVKEVVRQEVGKLDFSDIINLDTETLNEIIEAYKEGSLGSGGSDGGGSDGGSNGIDEEKFYELLNSKLNVRVLNEMTDKYLNGELSGGGSGAVSPTIETLYPSESVIEEGQRLDIDIFFQTPNLGEGTGYITINGIEIDYYPILNQGDNIIKIESKYLTKSSNVISIYVKDRTGMTSNKLNFKVVSGGITFTTTFDYTIDYVVGQNILFPFETVTELPGEITLEIVVDGIPLEPIVCANGYNSIYLNRFITGVGVHAVTIQAFVGEYHSKPLNFNIVISSSTQLMISTTLLEGTKFEYGNPVQMPYRISKLGSEVFTIEFYIDEILMRTASASAGNYFWTISGTEMNIGIHKLDIIVYGIEGDRASISINIEIEEGEFVPLLPVDQGMVCFLDSDGYSNEQQDKTIWIDKSGHGNNGELIDFNFSTNGWSPIVAEVDNEGNEVTVKYNGLVCNNDAYVRIPYKPFRENVINGYTMEIVYTPEHSGNDLARVLEYVDYDSPYTGIFADINEANIKSESETSMGTVDLDYESGEIQLDFVIDRENKMCRMYVNGIVSRYWMLSDSGMNRESFAIDTDYIYINFSGLSEKYCGGTNIVRKFICYERALTHDEVIQNLIANQPDLSSMQQMYKWNYETQIPKLYIYGDISQCSSTNPSYVRVKFESPDTAKYGESFDMESLNTPFYLQGTSSLGYSRKNYRFVLYDSNGKEFFHKLHPDVLAESTFTLKCDYVDSSMCSNVCLAQIANDCVYGKGFTPAQKDNMQRRTAIYGHAIELINVVDNKSESLGAYMFNIDRYATKNMGYDTKQYPNMLCIEGESNSDVGSSAFYVFDKNNPLYTEFGGNEVRYHNEGWRVVYPPTNEEAYDFGAVKRLVDFVGGSGDDDFKDSFEQYFNKESVLKYYLFDMFIGGIDGLSKNFHLCSWDGLVYYILPYDLDSCLGGTNTGFLRVPPSCEVGTLYDADGVTILEENHFNSWNSQLWRRVRNTFSVDLENMYRTLRSNGLFTLENMLKYFDAVTDIISPKMYNDSQQIKYINDGADGTDALHGNRKLQIRKWLRERIAYLDSKYGYYAGGGVGENYCNFRMNYQGAVSLDLTTYYTVYAKVRWATNNEQTIRIARGQKKTFSYYSDVGTDREVMIFLPESLKTIENISKIYPNSIDVSKATKLTQIEAHNPNLFSVDLSKNKYLRKVDFNGCERLGTETATMTLNFCKYLTKVDLRGTQITAVNFNTKGGSLKEIYYPKSIQSVTLINQLLLTDMILPHGENGENIPTTLSSVDIQNCPNIIKTVDLTSDPTSLQGMKNCRNLTLNNSIMLERFNFYGFTRLANVNLQNMETLKEIDFLNMTEVGQETSLRYIGVSACPNLTRISMNCDDPNYEITWANNSLLDLQTAGAVEEISSNCIIKGLETIVLPRSIKGLYFTDEYGTGYSDLKNIWSAESCTVIKTGVFPEAQHLNSEGVVDDYVGIDFKGLNIANIDLGALVQIPKAINFSLYPTHVNPNFNLNRDGETLPYLQPIGILDLSNYTESLAKFFDGVDLDKLRIICNKEIPQKDFSYCFYNSSFSDDSAIDILLSKATGITNLDYCFYKTTVRSTDILNKVRMGNNSTMNYTFAECPNIVSLEGVTIPNVVTEVEGMFYGCPLTSVRNITVNVRGSISGLFKGCSELVEIRTMKIPNVTNVSSVFEGCSKLSLLNGFELPDSCTDVSNLFNGCYSLLDLTINLSDNITRGDNWFPPNLENLYDSNINNQYSKLTDCSTLKTVSNLYINGGDFSDMFNGCSSLSTVNVSMGTNITSLARFFKGCSKIILLPLNEIGNNCKDIEEIFRGTKITSIDTLVFGTGITNATNWAPTTLKEANNVTIKNNYTNFKDLTNLNSITNLTISNNVTTLKEFCSNCPSLIDFEFASPVSSINYNITTCENAFNGCTSLTNFNIPDAILTNTTNISGMFKNCSSLNASPISGINDKITNISYLFNGSPISNLSDFTFGSNITTYELWEPSVNYSIRNSTIKTSIKLFRNSLKVKYIDGLIINSNITDISYYFEGCTSLVEDFAIPTHIMNCSYCFYNCTGITHIYANWNNRYDRRMVPTDCYAGCMGITHIDNNYVLAYNGDTGLGYVHKDWGGFGFEFDYTSIYEVTIPSDNYTVQICSTYDSLTLPFNFEGLNVIDYGDGSYWSNTAGTNTTTIPTHTYASAGVYYIKGNYVCGMNKDMPSSIRSCVTKVLRVAGYISRYDSVNDTNVKSVPSRQRMFANLTNLTSVNISNLPLNSSSSLEYFFSGCSSLNEDGILGIETIDFTKVSSMKYFFAGTSITYLDLTPYNTENVANFEGCFNKCTKLITITGLDLSTWKTFSTTGNSNMTTIFSGCSNLETIYDFHINIGNCLSGTNFITQEYWILTGWKMFANLNKLVDIQCHGVLTDYPTLTKIYLFSGFNHRNLTEESWLSLISMLGSTAYTKTVYFSYLSSVPSYVIEDLTNKGYSVAQG